MLQLQLTNSDRYGTKHENQYPESSGPLIVYLYEINSPTEKRDIITTKIYTPGQTAENRNQRG